MLQLVDLVAGRYMFSLTVLDAEGLTNSDMASIIVRPDIHKNDLVELQLNADISTFMEINKVRLLNFNNNNSNNNYNNNSSRSSSSSSSIVVVVVAVLAVAVVIVVVVTVVVVVVVTVAVVIVVAVAVVLKLFQKSFIVWVAVFYDGGGL